MSVNKEEKCDHLDTKNICVNKTTQGQRSNPELKSPQAEENSYLSLFQMHLETSRACFASDSSRLVTTSGWTRHQSGGYFSCARVAVAVGKSRSERFRRLL
jgi:hypothetical protein